MVLAVFLFIFMQNLCIFILFCGQFLGLKKALIDVFARDQVVFDGLAGDKAVFRRDGFAADEPFGGLWRDAENDSQHAIIHFFGEK